MKRPFMSLCACTAFLSAASLAQGVDSEAMMRWGSASLIRYHIVGVYDAPTAIASNGQGRADVKDRVIIDLSWKLSEMKLVGEPVIQNFKSQTANLRDFESACLPPVLKGEYEHYDLLSVKNGLSGALELLVRVTYPVVEIAQSCRASRMAVPAKVVTAPRDMALPSPMLFAMPPPASGELSVSPDKKSLVVKKGGWTWTYTPTAVGED